MDRERIRHREGVTVTGAQAPGCGDAAITRVAPRAKLALLRVSGPWLLLVLAACQAAPAPQETLEQVERRRFDAMIAQDLAALEPMLGEELYYGHSTAQVENKAQFLESIRSGRFRYRAIEVKHVDVRLYDEVALLTGLVHVRVEVGGQPLETDLRYSDAYVRRDGRWQLVAWQSVRVP